ncbi:hypothetical protein NA78x_006078 [Anatilimnocola sp. NA78]|uniref:hypothetical protein n=1 Tax=Anatilimnocola sp. NA78 TaxID=3415683 RepID=UPI003CE5C030
MWILDNEYNPALLIFLTVFVCLAVFVAWIQSGKKEVLYALGIVALVGLALVIYERVTLSDREAIQATLVRIARDLETNNRQAVYDSIHSAAPDIRAQAESELPQYTFSQCRISKIDDTKVTGNTPPKTASVEFYIIAAGSFAKGGDVFGGEGIRRLITLGLQQENDGQWKVVSYSHRAPLDAPDEIPGNSSP